MVFSGRGALVWKAISPTGLGKLILISEIAAVGQPKASLSDFARRDSPQWSVNIQQVVRNEHTFSQGMFFPSLLHLQRVQRVTATLLM